MTDVLNWRMFQMCKVNHMPSVSLESESTVIVSLAPPGLFYTGKIGLSRTWCRRTLCLGCEVSVASLKNYEKRLLSGEASGKMLAAWKERFSS